MQVSTLRPGLLVSLKTTVSGNVSYQVTQLEAERVTATGEARARWETTKTVTDPQEHQRATEARAKARWTVARICATSAFGLLCPENRAAELEAAINEARRIVDEFNRTAAYTRLGVYVISGRIAADDVEAVRAINSEVTELLATMEKGVAELDAGAIREAANKARNLGSMLTKDAAERVQVAIDAARTAARKITKAGEGAAIQIDQYVIQQITAARTAFIDLSEIAEVQAPEAAARPVEFAPETDDDEPAAPKGWDKVEAGAPALDYDEPAPVINAAPASFGANLVLEF